MRAVYLFHIFLLAACAPQIEPVAGRANEITGSDVHYTICSGYGCPVRHQAKLNAGEWRSVRSGMLLLHSNAFEERAAVANAIARFEQLTGSKTGTADDQAGTFGTEMRPGQMDCLDEATNTATYLQLLQKAGLLRFHTPAGRARRGGLLGPWPHTSAILRERATGQLWVVDSWFLENGKPPFILPLEIWRDRWYPPGWNKS